MPLVFAQSVMLLGDVPVAAFGTMAVYYACVGRLTPFLVAATVAASFKITAVAIVVPCAVYLALTCPPETPLRRPWLLLVALLPLTPLAVYMVAQRIATGTWFPNPWLQAYTPEAMQLAPLAPLYCLLARRGQWILTLLLVLSLIIAWRKVARREVLLLLTICWCLCVGVSPFVLPRYILPALALLAVMAAYGLRVMIQSLFNYLVGGNVVALGLVASTPVDYSPAGDGPPDTSMLYVHAVRLQQDAARHLMKHHQGQTGVSGWPAIDFLIHRL